jgi:hypothetical protein
MPSLQLSTSNRVTRPSFVFGSLGHVFFITSQFSNRVLVVLSLWILFSSHIFHNSASAPTVEIPLPVLFVPLILTSQIASLRRAG